MTEEQEQQVKQQFSQSLRVVLAKEQRSQRWLAHQLELTRPFICNLCNGDRLPSLSTIKRVCDLFNISISEFAKLGE